MPTEFYLTAPVETQSYDRLRNAEDNATHDLIQINLLQKGYLIDGKHISMPQMWVNQYNRRNLGTNHNTARLDT